MVINYSSEHGLAGSLVLLQVRAVCMDWWSRVLLQYAWTGGYIVYIISKHGLVGGLANCSVHELVGG